MGLRLFVIAVLLAGCGSSIRRPETTQLSLTGTVTNGGFDTLMDPLSGVRVALVGDDGSVLASNLSSSTGGYRLLVPLSAPRHVALRASRDGFATVTRGLTVSPSTELTLSFALSPLNRLECVDTGCTVGLGDLAWLAAPPTASGSVATFDPAEPPVVLEPHPPGDLLAIAAVSLDAGTDADPGFLALRIPREKWSLVGDSATHSGAVEVDVLTLPDVGGAWVSAGRAQVFSEAGLPLTESELSLLEAGTWSGGAVAHVPFVGQGLVAVAGTPGPRGCLSGTLDADGQPGAGVVVMADLSEPTSAGSDGLFCTSFPFGETLTRVEYAGLPYVFTNLPAPVGPGTCGSGCAKAGTVTLAGDALEATKPCQFTGVVVDAAGAPVKGLVVEAFDDSLVNSAWTTLCGAQGEHCTLSTTTDDLGHFAVNLAALNQVHLRAKGSRSTVGDDATVRGAWRLPSCPTSAVTVSLTGGHHALSVQPTFTGTTLTWSPARDASHVVVARGATVLWELVSNRGLTPPLTFGTVPANAVEVVRASSSPAAGDVATVTLEGTGQDGAQYEGEGQATHP
jgi:hypothetical protein